MHIHLRDLHHNYPQPGNPPLTVFENLNLNIGSGQFIAILGPSGCGKSTLLRLLAGLLQPTRGTILLNGAPPSQAVQHKRIGFLAQNPALLPWRTALQNVALAQRVNPQRSPLPSPQTLLNLVGLTDFAAAYPHTLSGGMAHRLALARTLATAPDLWLMDEPFAALDELTREQLTADLLELWVARHPTVIWVTHHIYESLRIADSVLVFSPRPMHLLAQWDVPTPRPRREDSAEFQTLLRAVRAALGLPTLA